MELWILFILLMLGLSYLIRVPEQFSNTKPHTRSQLDKDIITATREQQRLRALGLYPRNKNVTKNKTKSSSTHTQLNYTKIVTEPQVNSMYISKQAKLDYTQSQQWYNLKQQRLGIANYCCESTDCNRTAGLECHHITYERLTEENIDDLRIVCRDCHQQIHNKHGYSREGFYPII